MPSPVKMKFTGDKEMLAKMQNFAKKFPEKIAGALFKRAEKIMTRSKRDFAPVDWGTMRDTGIVMNPEILKGKISVTLAYGGPAVSYAVVQHEDLTLSHTHGEAKYLEKPLNQAASKLAVELAKDLRL